MNLSPLSQLAAEAQRRLSVSEYHRMMEVGILQEDEHLELLGGVLVEMTPQNPAHARVVQRLTRILARGLHPHFDLRVQLPLTLGPSSEPEPDFAIVPAGEEGTGEHHPTTALWVIEVTSSSGVRDRTVKAALYAGADIPEYWVIDLANRTVEVRQSPDAGAALYRDLATHRGPATLAPAQFPGLGLRIQDLFESLSGLTGGGGGATPRRSPGRSRR